MVFLLMFSLCKRVYLDVFIYMLYTVIPVRSIYLHMVHSPTETERGLGRNLSVYNSVVFLYLLIPVSLLVLHYFILITCQ